MFAAGRAQAKKKMASRRPLPGLDTRSLAAFRVVTALVLVAELQLVSLPALGLLVGYRTRASSWACAAAIGLGLFLPAAFPGFGGAPMELLFPILLSPLLPWGARFSLDHAWRGIDPDQPGNERETPERVLTPATLLLAIVAISTVATSLGLLRTSASPGALLALALPFLPASAWNPLARIARDLAARSGLAVHYDAECAFCRRFTHALVEALGLPEGVIRTAQSDPAIAALMERERSWVIVSDGRTLLRFEGFLALLRCSPGARLIAPLLGIAPIRALGDRLYRALSARRDLLGRLPPRYTGLDPAARPGIATELLVGAAVLAYFVLGLLRAL